MLMNPNQVYPWLTPIWQKLEQNLQQDRIPGALLFQGAVGVAPLALIERYIAGLMCQNDASEPCGFCHSCGLIQSQSHPDVHFVVAEKDKAHLSVEQVRQANQWALESSQFGHYRVIVINNAETLTVAASNALLKTLEEPANGCLFVLNTTSVKKLLPTIRSRCEVWNIASPNQSECMEWVGAQLGRDVPISAGYLCNFEPITTLQFVEKGLDKSFSQLSQALEQFVAQGCIDAQAVWSVINKVDASIEVTLGWLWTLLFQAQLSSLKQGSLNQGSSQKSSSEQISSQPSKDREVLSESLPLATRFHYELLYQQARDLAQLRQQLLTHPGLNAELLVCNWLYQFDR